MHTAITKSQEKQKKKNPYDRPVRKDESGEIMKKYQKQKKRRK